MRNTTISLKKRFMPYPSAIVNYVFYNPYQLFRFCKAEGFFPESLWFVADDQDTGVVVFCLDILAQLVERPVDVLFLAGQKQPAGTRMKAAAILLESCRRVCFGIDADRNEKRVLAQTIAKRFLDLFEIAIERRTDTRAGGEERVDDHHFVFKYVAVEVQCPAVLV